MKFKMATPKNLTEEQRRLFLKYESIPAGFSRAEMIELTGQNNQMNDRRYEHKEPITERNFYKHCEICKRILPVKFYPPGQRFRNRHSEAGIGKSGRGYCHICHKSMCSKCSVGIVCKNCIEFFPEPTKYKSITLKKWWKIIRYIGIFFPFFVITLILFSPPPISDLTYSELALIVLAYLVTLLSGISFYYIFKYFEDTIANFLKDLNVLRKSDKHL